ncbi:HD domain-containing protein [Candidatus Parcubacteria bacterium]|nr:HD domain-containing protein [Patescibacteria group bacterium]MBU4466935.1 HD domain-containing protein [Patescibacteria group bacterium]MCG2688676.1 HD domain-containing protein [Candidatus Parcubacteria bacterium]
MIIEDKVYGKIKINEPVLLELIKCPSILRLKTISQYGVPDRYYHIKNYSRFEHSVGVMIILRKLGASLEEQIAGLLHDVSVLAFSHIADWVFAEGDKGVEDLHDTLHRDFISKTEVPKILKKYNFLLERVLNEDNFSLLETKIPNLCADRVDYSLREFKYWLNAKIVGRCLRNLANFNGEMVFTDQRVAYLFATNFLKLQMNHWGGYEAMIRYYLFSNVLKVGLKKKIILKEDFFKEEKLILEKIERSQNKEIKDTLILLTRKDLKGIKVGSGNRRVRKKFRYVDPKVILKGQLVCLSEIDPSFRAIIDKSRKISEEGLLI